MSTTAIAVMVRREKDIIRAFQGAGALSARTAKPMGALGLEESRHFERLRGKGVIRPGEPGTWYVDQTAWDTHQATRRRIALVLLAVIGFALALGLGVLPRGPS
jgi:hypothetical protein